MIGYSTLYKSMNGIKVLSDGVSIISDGQAQHDNIIYNDYIYSQDSKTQLTNNKVKTEDIECLNFDSENIMSLSINSNFIQTKRFLVNNNNTDYFQIDTIINNKLTSNIEMDLYEKLNIIDKDIAQTQTGRIYQQGTSNNYLKDTYINGYLEIGSNLTQLGGSSSLKDLTIDNLTLRENKGISQTGLNVSNTLAGTTITKDLVILNSVVFPSSVTIPGTTTTDDIIMEGDSVIIQDITSTTTKKNIFRNTKSLDLEIDGSITQIKGGSFAIFKNTTIQGIAEIQGDITQTAGTTILKTLRCNNITLNDDQLITQSGTGYITQSGTGQNILKEINLLSNGNLIFNGSGIISQPLNGLNILSHFRSAGYGIIGGRNNTTFTNYQNIQNNNGLQFQFNRDNSNQYSFLMNNRGTGGNGGFRFQRYIGGVYLDEPLIIDDNITINKNVSIPSGSISCSSATLGIISQTELDCLDNCNLNILTKFNSLDTQISSLQTTTGGVSTATTGITYTSGTDTTLIDNNLTISTGKNLLVGTTNILNSITSLNSSVSTINTKLTGITYASGTDTTNIDNNIQITAGKKLYIGTMDVEAEINALDTSFTTGTINSTDLATNTLRVYNTARFGDIGGTTFIKNDIRLCNVINKSESEFTQLYLSGNSMNIINQRPSGDFSFQIKNSTDTAIVEYIKLNSTSLNVKNTNVDVDNNLNVDGSTTLNNLTVYNNLIVDGSTNLNTLNITNDLNVNKNLVITNCFETFSNTVTSIDYTEQVSITANGQTPEQDLISFTLDQPFTKEIILNLSFSGGLNWKNYNTSSNERIQYNAKINYFTVFIFKNGVLWRTNYPQSNVQGLLYDNTFRLPYSIKTENFKYFMNNSLITFQPDVRSNNQIPDTYSFRVSFNFLITLNNYTISTNTVSPYTASFLTFTPCIYSNVTYTYNGSNSSLISTSTVLPIDIVNYTPGVYAISSYSINGNIYRFGLDTNTIEELQCVNSFTNNARANTLTTTNANITTASINNISNYVKTRSMIASFMFNGATSFSIMPITCSIIEMSTFDVDDYYLINAGYKLILYDIRAYTGSTQEYANDTNEPYMWSPTNKNTTSSIRVYYRNNTSENWVEIKYNYIS